MYYTYIIVGHDTTCKLHLLQELLPLVDALHWVLHLVAAVSLCPDMRYVGKQQ